MIHDLTTAMNRLSDVLQRENAALSELDLAAAATFVAEKRLAMEAFAQAHAAGDEPAPQAPPIEAAARLKELAHENRLLLGRAIAVQSRVIGIVARAFPVDPNPLYAASGAITRAGRPVAISLSARA